MRLPNIVCKLCGSDELVLVGIENFRCSTCGSPELCSTRSSGPPIVYRPKTLGVPGACVLACAIALLGCSAAQIQDATAKIAVACQTAMPLASSALALPTVGPFIAAGVMIGCGSDAAIARLAADPSSAAWLDQQAAMLKNALHR